MSMARPGSGGSATGRDSARRPSTLPARDGGLKRLADAGNAGEVSVQASITVA